MLDMATMNISLPDSMREWVEKKTKSGQYSNNSDYVRDLIRKDQERGNKIKALQAAIDQGLASGSAGALDMNKVKQKAKQQAGLKD